jgi:phospholipid/cholesterol/gamma-HCH transport system substrate-binding protein
MRRVIGILGALVVAGTLWLVLGASSNGPQANQYWIELDNAFGLVNGGDLKIAGVRAGKITKLKLDKQTNRALVGIEIDKTGFGDLRSDTHCDVRPQSLIGEYFIDCQPGTSRVHLKGGAVIPVSHTTSTVAPDLVNDVLRKPYRERLSIIINELGAAVAGNGQNLNDAIRRASPALRETDKVLGILANQNKVLGDLVKNGDTVVNDLANNKHNVQRWVVEARDTAKATAERQAALAEGFRKLPGFLEQLRPTMAALGDVADQQTPALTRLRDNADQLTRLFNDLGPYANASRPAFKALGKASQTGDKAVKAAKPVVSQLNTFSTQTPELAKNLAIVLQHLDNRNFAVEKDPRSPGGQGYTGLEALLEYVYDQGMSVNSYDANTHSLKVALQAGGNCADYADIQRAKQYGSECGAALGPNLAGINYEDTTAPPGGNTDAVARRKNRKFDGDPSTQPVTAPAPPVQIPGGDAGIQAAPPIEVPQPSGGSGPIQIPQVPGLPKVGVNATNPGQPTDQRTNQALLDYLMGN